ncbi:MAG: ABC transporter substrate-binding protein [Tissierellia bacterium]|nr:ABC transporter substrate-binding protein [Tissierellia bacterium]
MNKFKRFLTLIMAIVILAGCNADKSGLSSEDTDRETKIKNFEKRDFNLERHKFKREYVFHKELPEYLTFGLIGEIGELNPFLAKEDSSKKILSMLYKPLFYLEYKDYEKEVKPVIIEDIKISDDGLKYEMRLKKGIKWHDGKDMTADDMIYTYDYLVKNKDTVYRDYMYIDDEAVKIKEKDKYTVELTLNRYSDSFLDKLSEIKIMPKHIYDGREEEKIRAEDSDMLIGNSAYAFSKYDIDEKYNTEYMDFEYKSGSIYDKPQFEMIRLRKSANEYTNRYDLLDYNFQAGYVLPNDTEVFANELFDNIIFDDGYDIAMVYKVNRENVKDKENRQNLSKLFSPSSVTGHFGMSNYVKAADSIFSFNTFHYSPQNEFFDGYRGIASDQLVRFQAENKKDKFKFGFKMEEGEYQEKIAIMLQELMRTINLNFELAPLFEDEYIEAISNPNTDLFDFCLVKYDSIKSPDEYKKFFEKNSEFNFSGYENQNLNRLWREADSEKDYIKAQIIYDEIQSILYDEIPMYPIVNVKTSFIFDDRFVIEDAIPDARGFFIAPEKLRMNDIEIDETRIDDYDFEKEELENNPRYDNLNIQAKDVE